MLFTHPVGCSRLLSTVNDLTTIRKNLQSVTSGQLCEETAQRVPPSYDAALSRAQRCLTLMNSMSSTSNRSTATMMCWMKKTTNAVSANRSSPDSRWRRCNFVNPSPKSDRSFIGALCPHVLREIHQFFKSQKLVGRHAIGDPDADFFKFDQFWVASHEILNLAGSDHEFLEKIFDASLS